MPRASPKHVQTKLCSALSKIENVKRLCTGSTNMRDSVNREAVYLKCSPLTLENLVRVIYSQLKVMHESTETPISDLKRY